MVGAPHPEGRSDAGVTARVRTRARAAVRTRAAVAGELWSPDDRIAAGGGTADEMALRRRTDDRGVVGQHRRFDTPMGDMLHTRRRTSTLLATMTTLILVAGACGSDDNADTKTTTGSGPVVAVTGESNPASGSGPATTAASPATTGGTAGSGSTAGTTAGSSGAPSGTDLANHHVGDEGTPVNGGTLVYGIDSDTANPWAPYRASYATSGYVPLASGVGLRCSPSTTNGESGAAARRVRRAQRRLHVVDDAHPLRDQVPGRHAARRRRGEVQHRLVPRSAR